MENLNKLSIEEVKKLYLKSQEASNEETKQLYIEKLLLETNDLVEKYIKKLKLDTLENSNYDIDDIKSSFTLAWYNSITNGDLLKKKKYDDIFLSEKFLKNYYSNLIGKNYNEKENIVEFKIEYLKYLFDEYVSYKQRIKEEKTHTYNFLEFYEIWIGNKSVIRNNTINNDQEFMNYHKISNADQVLDIFEKIYYNFDVNADSFSPELYDLFLKLLVRQKSEDYILDNNEALTKIGDDENTLFCSSIIKDFSDTVKKELKKENEKIVFIEKFGLNDGIPKEIDEIAPVIDKSVPRTRQIADSALKKVLQNTNILRYAPYENKGDK